MADQETCKTERGCTGIQCIGVADVKDQTHQIVAGGNPHKVTPEGGRSFLGRKRQNLLPICLQALLLERSLNRAQQQLDEHFNQQK